MALKLPFPYESYLIGEEVMQRCLEQKQRFAGEGKYGQEWTSEDQIAQAAIFLQAATTRESFAIPSEFDHCIPEPPCPWPKDADVVDKTMIKSTIFAANGVYSYRLAVHQSVVTSTTYSVGPKVIDFVGDQAALDPAIKGEYLFFQRQDISPYIGMAVFQIERLHQGNLDRLFRYLFDMTQT